MKPSYLAIPAGESVVLGLDTNVVAFNVSIRTDADTVELALETADDAVSSYSLPVGPGPTWFDAPAANTEGIVVLTYPVSQVRLTAGASDATATVLQQGLR